MRRLALVLPVLMALAACGQTEAPSDLGVCWRVSHPPHQAARFSILARGVDDLDTCAVLLEGLRLQGRAATDGAYQGYFIFVGAGGPISSARRLDGFRYPIFQPPQRAAVDRDLRRLMQARGGQMPSADEIGIERAR
jgi:hypothetical protein